MKHVSNTIGILLVVALITAMAADADAKNMNKSKALMMSGVSKAPISITSEYLGTLQGDVLIGGKRVYIPRKTPVYVVGEGIQEGEYFSNGEIVYVTAVWKAGKAVAKMIVVRPDGSGQRRSDGTSSEVGEYSDDVPR
jgi:hypothetical protein